jgi:hypothetical protein
MREYVPDRERKAATTVKRIMFFLFSTRLGCLGSLALSALLTLMVLVLLGWVRL